MGVRPGSAGENHYQTARHQNRQREREEGQQCAQEVNRCHNNQCNSIKDTSYNSTITSDDLRNAKCITEVVYHIHKSFGLLFCDWLEQVGRFQTQKNAEEKFHYMTVI